MLSQKRGGGENLVALEARHAALHVSVSQVFLEGAPDLEARATDSAFPGHEVFVGVHMHQEVCFTGYNFSTSLALVLSIHLVLFQELLNLWSIVCVVLCVLDDDVTLQHVETIPLALIFSVRSYFSLVPKPMSTVTTPVSH